MLERKKVNVEYNGGILIRIADRCILADPKSIPNVKPDLVLLSHAHSDHYSIRALRAIRKVPKVMSRATREIIEKKHDVKLREVVDVEDGFCGEVNGIYLEAYNAGHCIGSLQFRLNFKDSIVYTGDVNLSKRLVLEKARILKGDVLIIESTYGLPSYIFPDRRKLYCEILENIVGLMDMYDVVYVGGRSLGTLQELTFLLSVSRIGMPVVVHPAVYLYNLIHEKYGPPLGSYISTSKYIPGKPRGIHLIPLNLSLNAKLEPAIVCTGWSIRWNKSNAYPLSSHVDFSQLLEYVEKSGAEEVYTVYGFTKAFADYINSKLGIYAKPL